MARTVFNKKLTLLQVRAGYGRADSTDVQARVVCAAVSVPTLRLSAGMEAAGRRVDLTAVVRRSDYLTGAYNYAEYAGQRYRIDSDHAADKEQFVLLTLGRG